jgi:hypothetical protein
MTFSFSARLYSMITGQLLSSRPSVSMRPPCALPVTYSVATNRTPRNDSRCCSINDCRDFSMSTDSARSSRAESDWSWNSFISAKALIHLSGQPVRRPNSPRLHLRAQRGGLDHPFPYITLIVCRTHNVHTAPYSLRCEARTRAYYSADAFANCGRSAAFPRNAWRSCRTCIETISAESNEANVTSV